MRTYQVAAYQERRLTAEVLANSEEEALLIAEDLDYEDWKEDPNFGTWEYTGAVPV